LVREFRHARTIWNGLPNRSSSNFIACVKPPAWLFNSQLYMPFNFALHMSLQLPPPNI
jgi:hypothetical protein